MHIPKRSHIIPAILAIATIGAAYSWQLALDRALADRASYLQDAESTLYGCVTDMECDGLHAAICRQDGQSDWSSVQINVEFDCFDN